MFSARLPPVAENGFAKLLEIGGLSRPVMQDIGEALVLSSKQRFVAGVAPSGARWAPNSQVTYLRYLDKFSTSYNAPDKPNAGRLSAAGANRASSKKPLIGETRSLSTQISYRINGQVVEIGSPMEYAATHQFGAAARSFTGGHSPWGNIPARPFLGLSDADRNTIIEIVHEHIRSVLR